MVLSQKQRNKITYGIGKGLTPRIKSITGKGKPYNMIYIGRKSAGAASEENLRQVDVILVKHGLKPMFYPPKPVVLSPPIELKPSNETSPEGVKTEVKTLEPVQGVAPPITQTTAVTQPPATVTQPTVITPTPPPSSPVDPPKPVDPPTQDNQMIAKIMGLSDTGQVERYRDKGILTGTVPATGVISKIVGDAEWGFEVTAELGRVTMYEAMKHLTLNDEERKEPEAAVGKIEKWIRELVEMKYHAAILEDVLLANEVAKTAIQELQHYASVSALAYETVTNQLCDKCKRRAMWALAIKSVGGEQMLEREEVISK